MPTENPAANTYDFDVQWPVNKYPLRPNWSLPRYSYCDGGLGIREFVTQVCPSNTMATALCSQKPVLCPARHQMSRCLSSSGKGDSASQNIAQRVGCPHLESQRTMLLNPNQQCRKQTGRFGNESHRHSRTPQAHYIDSSLQVDLLTWYAPESWVPVQYVGQSTSAFHCTWVQTRIHLPSERKTAICGFPILRYEPGFAKVLLNIAGNNKTKDVAGQLGSTTNTTLRQHTETTAGQASEPSYQPWVCLTTEPKIKLSPWATP